MKKTHILLTTAVATFALAGAAQAQTANGSSDTGTYGTGASNSGVNQGSASGSDRSSSTYPPIVARKTTVIGVVVPNDVNASGTSGYRGSNTQIPTRMDVKLDASSAVAAGVDASGESPQYPQGLQRAMGGGGS